MKNKNNNPPTILVRIAEFFCNDTDRDIMLGDLHELFEERQRQRGRTVANMTYLVDFCTLLFNGAFRRRKKSYHLSPLIMIHSYITVAIRHMLRQKMHNAINVAGLGIGLSVSLVISLFVLNELSYDRFHEKGDRIWLLPMTWNFGGTVAPAVEATSGAAPFITENFPQVERAVRIKSETLVLNNAGQYFVEKNIAAVDSTFFDVFTFPMIAGNPETALRDPFSLVLTERAAEKYFGTDWSTLNILSKTLEGQNKKLYQITGVMKDPPANSHIQFDMLLSMLSLPGEKTTNWDNSSYLTYLLFHPGADAMSILPEIPARLTAQFGKVSADYVTLDLLPLHDVYLRNQKYPGMDNASDIRYVYVFSAIAAMVLIIALINYMNLSTARSLERAREVGVRRVVGAFRVQLFWQFMSESFFVTLISMALAVGIAYVSIPLFNELSGRQLDFGLFMNAQSFIYLIMLLALVTLLGGFYPALVLSGFKPVSVLKGRANGASGFNLRRVLVVVQFSISIVLIIATLMIREQLRFMSNAKVGIDKEQIIAISMDSVSRGRLPVLKKEIANVAGVESVVASVQLPVNATMRSAISFDGRDRQIVAVLGTASEFTRTAGVELIAGKNFSPDSEQRESWEFLLNETALDFFGISAEDAIGKEMKLWGSAGIVTGVVKDFHFAPLHKPIAPLIISASSRNFGSFNYLLLRVQPKDFSNSLEIIEKKWKHLVPEFPFEYTFLDERYNSLYLTESRLNNVMNVFSTLAILIAALGLFGLSSYTILRRTKELGIRKVMGASPSRLIVMVSGSFVRMIMLSFTLSVPVCWFIVREWLTNFHYHIDFNWWLVVATGAGTFVLTILIVTYHAAEASLANPVASLRTE